MVVLTRVEVDGDRPVVVKRAPVADAARLRTEGERLQRARHPGVVPVLRSEASDDGWELHLGHGGRPLASLGRLPAARVAGLAAALATTVADLHDLGIVHGHLDGTHVLVGPGGRPVLCGFGSGEPPARPHDDVAALGALLVDLLGSDETGEPIPDRRWWGHRRWAGWERRALLLLADQATAEPPTRRPTARRLAAAITEAVPGAAARDGPSTGARHARVEPPEDADIERLRATAADEAPNASVPARALVAVVIGLLLLVLGGRRLLADGPTATPAATALPTSTVAPATVRTATPVPGAVLEIDGRRFRVGQAGDAVLVEDWDCDGRATPALLRAATGEVFVFPRWSDEGTLAVHATVRVDGARALLSERSGDGCPTLAVRTETGDLVPVDGGAP